MKISDLKEFNVNDWLTDRETKQLYLHNLMSDVLGVPPSTTIVDGTVLQRLAAEVRRHVQEPAVLALVDELLGTSWPRPEDLEPEARTMLGDREPSVDEHKVVETVVDGSTTTHYFADGSGYVEGGGPCGPLYFDKFGNT